jgi:hypothetical protein
MTTHQFRDTDWGIDWLIECISIFWTLMGVTMPQTLTFLLDRKLKDYFLNFRTQMGGYWLSQWIYLDIPDSDGGDNVPEGDISMDRNLEIWMTIPRNSAVWWVGYWLSEWLYLDILDSGGRMWGIDWWNGCTSIFWTLMGVTMPQTLTVSRVERSNSRNVFSMSMSGLHPIRIFKNLISNMIQKLKFY